MIVYNKINGQIKSVIPDDQRPRVYKDIPPENIGTLVLESYPTDNIKYYYVVENSKLERYTEQEIKEIDLYGRILTEEERLNIILQPSPEEITKAKNTIEILLILQEVGAV